MDAPLAEKMLPLLRDPRPSLPVSALLIPTVAPRHALPALLALNLLELPPTLLLRTLPLLFASARLAFMVIAVPEMTAKFALMVELEIALKRLPALPLSLQIASARKAPTELMPRKDVPLALRALLPMVKIRLRHLIATDALPTTLEMLLPKPSVIRSLLAAQRVLQTPSPLPVPKLKLVAIARRTSTEMPKRPCRVELDALLAPMMVPLLNNLLLLSLRLLIVHAPITPTE